MFVLRIFFLMLVTTCFTFDSEKKLPHPYNCIEVLPAHYFSMCINQKYLDQVIKDNDVSIIVELGSWLGGSAMYMAKLLPSNGKIYCVDHWLGSEEHHRPHRTDVKHLLPTLYQQFLSNIIHSELTDKIIPYRATTVEAAKSLHVTPDLVYVDASHDSESVYNDIKNWYIKLAPGGIMCGDDWRHNGVNKGVRQFAEEHNIQIIAENNFWCFPPKEKS